MEKNKSLRLKNVVLSIISENDKSFFYLAPDIIGSVNNANLDYEKNIIVIDFNTTDGKNMALRTPYGCFEKWEESNKEGNGDMLKFLIDFVSKAKEKVESDDNMNEVVDEYGDLMGDGDEPANGNFSGIGRSKFDTDKTMYQTLAKQKRFYSDFGIGMVTW
jgi:hypothetical protein